MASASARSRPIRIRVRDRRRAEVAPEERGFVDAYFREPVDAFCDLEGVQLRRASREEAERADIDAAQADAFVLSVPQVSFFNLLVVQPVVTCTAEQNPGTSVSVTSSQCRLVGSNAPFLDAVNDCFDFFVDTAISHENGAALCISSEIEVFVTPPPPFDVFGTSLLEATGESVLSTATAALHLAFVGGLRRDFERFVRRSSL